MILDPISRRRAYFSFSGEPVPQEKLQELFEAAILAPSSGNRQPWRYFYGIQGSEGFEALFNCLDEGNQRWAGKAGALVLSAAQVRYIYKEKKHSNAYAWHDTGLANSLLMIQAIDIGLRSHPMAGFDAEKAQKAAGLNSDYEAVAMIAIGYPGNETGLPSDLFERQTSPRKRKHVDEIAIKL